MMAMLQATLSHYLNTGGMRARDHQTLARRHGLSRATLLYYDRIGLLKPSARRTNGYRHYAPRDDERLRQICLYRQTGLPLADIRRLFDSPKRSSRWRSSVSSTSSRPASRDCATASASSSSCCENGGCSRRSRS